MKLEKTCKIIHYCLLNNDQATAQSVLQNCINQAVHDEKIRNDSKYKIVDHKESEPTYVYFSCFLEEVSKHNLLHALEHPDTYRRICNSNSNYEYSLDEVTEELARRKR